MYYVLSSRRRHTDSDRDWSSDVCSSDLIGQREHLLQIVPVGSRYAQLRRKIILRRMKDRTGSMCQGDEVAKAIVIDPQQRVDDLRAGQGLHQQLGLLPSPMLTGMQDRYALRPALLIAKLQFIQVWLDKDHRQVLRKARRVVIAVAPHLGIPIRGRQHDDSTESLLPLS